MIFKIKVEKPFYLATTLFSKGEAELSREDLFTPWVKALAEAGHFTVCDEVQVDADELRDLLTEEQAALIDKPVLFEDPPEAVMDDAALSSDQPAASTDDPPGESSLPEPGPEIAPATETQVPVKAKGKKK